MKRLTAFLALACLASAVPASAAPHEVELTWFSIANWYFKFDNTRVIMDGYITRVPQRVFQPADPVHFPADQFAATTQAVPVDVAAVQRVHDALAANGHIDWLLAGHSHFDHTYDTPTWAKITGAPLIGGLSTCLQAKAQGLPDSQCRVVSGSWTHGNQGEKIEIAPGVTMRVVRFNHSGNASNPLQHFARELLAPPVPDPVNGGWRAGVGEDYPNGGGGRAFLFTIDNPGGPLSFFVNNSASAFDLTSTATVNGDIVLNGVNYGSPLDNLKGAMADAGLDHVDVWIGTGGVSVAQLVVPVIHPKVYIPNHWDGLFNPFEPGLPFPYADATLSAYLDSQHIPLMPQHQYFDTYRLDASGVTMVPNHALKQKLGYSDVQAFPATTTALVTRAATTVAPDDCDN
jgi:hypothetical protein